MPVRPSRSSRRGISCPPNAGILREIFFGVHRLGELKRALGISGNILTARLNQLTELGLVERQAYRPNPLIKSQLLRGIFLKT